MQTQLQGTPLYTHLDGYNKTLKKERKSQILMRTVEIRTLVHW